MTSLEQIVLPLAESRKLVERGVVLGTAMVWTGMATVTPNDMSGGWSHGGTVAPRYLAGRSDDVPAPTLSELLDAIRARYPDAEVSFYNRRDVGIDADFVSYAASCTDSVGGYPTDLLAACALLLEVAK